MSGNGDEPDYKCVLAWMPLPEPYKQERGESMERLTARNKNGEAYYPECYRKDGCDGFGGDCSNCKFNDGVCEMLAAYEDTCLTPDQIRQMDQLYREKCEELARYKAAI